MGWGSSSRALRSPSLSSCDGFPIETTGFVGRGRTRNERGAGGGAGRCRPWGSACGCDGEIFCRAHNETVARNDLTQHAELIAIQRALAALDTDRLENATLYVTLEPCAQCAGAIVLARVGRVIFGAYDPKAGMVGSVEDLLRHPRLNHTPEVRGGVLAHECGELLSRFFRGKRG